MLMKVKSCCGIPLPLGTKIIGFIFTMVAALACVMFSTPIFAQLEIPPLTALFYWLMALVSVAQFITGILLIIGAFKDKPSLLQPWVCISVAQSVSLVVLALIVSFAYVAAVMAEEIEDDMETNIIVTIYTVYAFILFYASSVVNSHRNELLLYTRTPEEDSII